MTDAELRGYIVLADYINTDAGGKTNVVGGGIRYIALLPNGQTPPFTALFVLESDLPIDEEVAVELSLTTATGQLMTLPGDDGRKQAVRIGHNVRFEPTYPPGLYVPRNVVPITNQFVMAFSNGLPLRAGFSYQFRLQVDHEPVASYSIYVPEPPSQPVVG